MKKKKNIIININQNFGLYCSLYLYNSSLLLSYCVINIYVTLWRIHGKWQYLKTTLNISNIFKLWVGSPCGIASLGVTYTCPIYAQIMLKKKRDNYIKNLDLLFFCRKSPHFSFLQNWTLTFQFSAKLDLDISIFCKLVLCIIFQFSDISIFS